MRKYNPSKFSSGGYRSGFEGRVHRNLVDSGVKVEYEAWLLEYYSKPYRVMCLGCDSKDDVWKTEWYLPDFYLPDVDLYIEAKGWFKGSDRAKMLAVAKAHPDKQFKFLFQRDNWLDKKHKGRYSDWCIKHGFDYAIGEAIPDRWKEKVNDK